RRWREPAPGAVQVPQLRGAMRPDVRIRRRGLSDPGHRVTDCSSGIRRPTPSAPPVSVTLVFIKSSGTPDDHPVVNLRTGWTPRILGAVLALFAGWYVVAHAD